MDMMHTFNPCIKKAEADDLYSEFQASQGYSVETLSQEQNKIKQNKISIT